MVIVIISSKTDPASTNIKKSLLKLSSWEEIHQFYQNPVLRNSDMENTYLITINDDKIFHENIDDEIIKNLNIIPKQAIFISRHRSKMATPSLTVHPIGNYNKAEFGGKSKTLVQSSPHLMTNLLRLIKKNTPINFGYQVCFEVTHHGPYLKVPTLFVEVGSTEIEWNKSEPAEIIAKSLIELLNNNRSEEDFSSDIPILVGVGGGHYAPRFTDVIFEKDAVFGHMVPSYHIDTENIDEKIFDMAIEKTPNPFGVYIHKKAFKKSQVTKLKQLFEKKDINIISSKNLDSIS